MAARDIVDNIIRWGVDNTAEAVDGALDWANERTIRLAVTGLSRAGKTIFTTALVHNLIRFPRRRQILPAIADLDIVSVIERPHRNPALAAFPYDDNLEALTASPPRWPPSTKQLSEIRIEVHYRPRSWLRRQINRQAVLNIDIVDYPGEWLLDLPLLSTRYDAWSSEMLELAQREPRRRFAKQWLAALATASPAGPADDTEIRKLSQLYRRYLEQCTEPSLGLTLVQPGRFLQPGHWDADAPFLSFCPLNAPKGNAARGDTLYAAMAERYDAYRTRVVREFYEKHFTDFDRQIVLVDLLRSLKAGPEAFEDAGKTMSTILDSFEHGRASLLARLGLPWGRHKIDRVVFAASKADHVSRSQHGNLESLLEDLLDVPSREIAARAVEIKVMALSGLRCTADRIAQVDGNRLSVVVGIPVDASQERVLFPGDVPDRMPARHEWHEDDYRFIDFLPKRVPPGAPQGFEHIRLDEAIRYLIGDRFS
jgi:uncharacterized protein